MEMYRAIGDLGPRVRLEQVRGIRVWDVIVTQKQWSTGCVFLAGNVNERQGKAVELDVGHKPKNRQSITVSRTILPSNASARGGEETVARLY